MRLRHRLQTRDVRIKQVGCAGRERKISRRTSSGSSFSEVRNNGQCGLALRNKLKPNIGDKISFIINRTGPIHNANDDTALAIVDAVYTENP